MNHIYPARDFAGPYPPTLDATLYFGGRLEDNHSLIGGNAWCLLDRYDKHLAHSSYAVIQTFPSEIRLEYEGLLNGLQAALMKRKLNIRIRGSCKLAIEQYATGRRCPGLGSLYHSLSDIDVVIIQALSRFQHVEFELISPEMNYFVYSLSKNAIEAHRRKEKVKMEKKISIT
jgi:ribonuclease HI